ncbi:GNAT family N-acetyltransferase [Cellulosimicrobium marinum]|uniref:GNAT family N-acetyltransferase n=1 Tax=Cellulosimicrobium marinum TaxID=1638992 RepID=UPI001E328598|nr:GNAT family N-acetyltransferase [Cellulosimicrobium marinum]MCB7136229.1 GNAT family N-acetyltransferase [Cellulosimicrobium marinum]
MNPLPIRPARTSDAREVARLYDICLRTGASGADATDLYADPRLLGEVYLGAYLALEPGLAFVLDADGLPAGYVLGARDTAAFEDACEREWWPPLRERYPRGAFPAGSRDAALVEQIHAPHRAPAAVVDAYPAHLHVDLLPEAQGGGNGRRLLETLFDALRADGVPGVHLGVGRANVGAVGFYRHLGFVELASTEGGHTLGLRL